ncbi:MAG: ribosomal RNA small subunit methyltransferase A [Nitrospirae bacterium]|nr:ribosomal RNA small subunit methyltransferase A [Nitrospirota bacterium]
MRTSKSVEVSKVTSDDIVVEIGPGHGSLTRVLSEVAKKVIAIELDDELYEKLKSEFSQSGKIELIHADAMKYPYEKLEPFRVVANIPYYITTPLIFRLMEAKKNLKSMTLTIQKEVAQRIVAKPHTKEYGVLSIAIRFYAAPKLEFIIPKGAFRPVPKVDSAVIHMDMMEKPRVAVKDEKLFFKIVRMAFSQRRKTLSNALKPISGDIKETLIAAGIDPVRRAETLSIEEFGRLADTLFDKK